MAASYDTDENFVSRVFNLPVNSDAMIVGAVIVDDADREFRYQGFDSAEQIDPLTVKVLAGEIPGRAGADGGAIGGSSGSDPARDGGVKNFLPGRSRPH